MLNITIKHLQTEMDLCLTLSIMSLALSACRHLSHNYFSNSFCFLYTCIYGPGIFRQIFVACWLLVFGKPDHSILIQLCPTLDLQAACVPVEGFIPPGWRFRWCACIL